jgi:hypothetical protein
MVSACRDTVRRALKQQLGMFSYVSVESRIPADHPIRKLRVLVGAVLKQMDADFAGLYRDWPPVDSSGTAATRSAQLRHACIHYRPGCAAGTRRFRQGGQAELSGERADGEPQRPDRGVDVRHASGTGERDGALALLDA